MKKFLNNLKWIAFWAALFYLGIAVLFYVLVPILVIGALYYGAIG